MDNEMDFLKEYIFSGMDTEGLTGNDTELMEYLYGDDDEFYFPSIEYDPAHNVVSKTYLILVSEDDENAFMYPAQALRFNIRQGAYDFVPEKDQVRLIDIHNFQDINDALKSNNNIYAIFIYGHSFGGSAGFAIGPHSHERYNIGYSEDMERSVPVTEFHTANVLPEGFIHLYSCNAISDSGEDIAHAMARHFGVRVWASKSGVSLWPPLVPASWKTGVYANPLHWLFDKTIGFEWVLP